MKAITEKTRVSVNVAGFVSILVGAIYGTWTVSNLQNKALNELAAIRSEVVSIKSTVTGISLTGWRVEDQIAWSYELRELTGINIPDPRVTVRDRLSVSQNPKPSSDVAEIKRTENQ